MKKISVVMGLILLAFGAIPILNNLGVTSLAIIIPNLLIQIGLLIGGIYLFIDAANPGLLSKKPSIIIGIIALVLGAFPFLRTFNIIAFDLTIPLIILNIILLLTGLFLVIDGFTIRY